MTHKTDCTPEQRASRAVVWIGVIIAFLAVISGAFSLEYRFLPKHSLNTAGTYMIKGEHYYNADNVHVVEGWVSTPDECYRVHTDTRVAESFPEQVTLAVTLEKLPRDESCAAGPIGIPFKTTFQASAEARIVATLNGKLAELKLIDRQGAAVALGSSMDLKIREQRSVGAVKVRFDAVESDSRCPVANGAECVRMGEAELVFSVDGQPVRVVFSGDNVAVPVGSYVLTVLGLEPVGLSADSIRHQATVRLEAAK